MKQFQFAFVCAALVFTTMFSSAGAAPLHCTNISITTAPIVEDQFSPIFSVGSVNAHLNCTGGNGNPIEVRWTRQLVWNGHETPEIVEIGGVDHTISQSAPAFVFIRKVEWRQYSETCQPGSCDFFGMGQYFEIRFDQAPTVQINLPSECFVRRPTSFSVSLVPNLNVPLPPSARIFSTTYYHGQEIPIIPISKETPIFAESRSAFGIAGGTDSKTLSCRNVPLVGVGEPIVLVNPDHDFSLRVAVQDPLEQTLSFEWSLVESPAGMNPTGEVAFGMPVSRNLAFFATPPQGEGFKTGEYKFQIKVRNEDGEVAFGSQKVVLTNSNTHFGLVQPEVGQSAFQGQGGVTLIRGKPVAARVKVRRPTGEHDSGDQSLVGVSGIFYGQGGDPYELVGCIRSSDIRPMDPNVPGFDPDVVEGNVLLVAKANATGSFPDGPGSFILTFNPPAGVSSIPAKVGCGDQNSNAVLSKPEWNTAVASLSYGVVESPRMDLHFFEMAPPCMVGPECVHTFKQPDNYAQFVERASKLTRALFPIAPMAPFFNSKRESVPVVAAGGKVARMEQRVGAACPENLSRDERDRCFWHAAEALDLAAIRAAGLNVTKKTSGKFIGVASRREDYSPNGDLCNSPEIPEQPNKGYFDWLFCKFRIQGDRYRGALGIEFSTVPGALLATNSNYFVVPHELVHEFSVRYPAGSDNGHQVDAPTEFAKGVWVDLLKDTANDNMPDLKWIDALYDRKSSFMVAQVPDVLIWGQGNYWMDRPTYTQLLASMSRKRTGRVSTKRIEGDQYLISGLVTMGGEFVVGDVFYEQLAGQTVGSSEHSITFELKGSDGKLINELTSPLSFKMEIVGSEEESTQISPVSTGIPSSSAMYSIEARTTLSRAKTVFYPLVEILRTAVGLIPELAFLGNPQAGEAALMNSLMAVEQQLASKNFVGAKRILNTEFRAAAGNFVDPTFSSDAPLSTDLTALLGLVEKSREELSKLEASFPGASNGLLSLTSDAMELPQNGKSNVSLIALTRPENSEHELYATLSLDGVAQKISAESAGRWSYTSPRLASGVHEVSAQLYSQERRGAAAIGLAIARKQEEKFKLELLLADETDPDERAGLLARISAILRQVEALESQLAAARVKIGTPISVRINVL